jgi:hypothetical protein
VVDKSDIDVSANEEAHENLVHGKNGIHLRSDSQSISNLRIANTTEDNNITLVNQGSNSEPETRITTNAAGGLGRGE